VLFLKDPTQLPLEGKQAKLAGGVSPLSLRERARVRAL